MGRSGYRVPRDAAELVSWVVEVSSVVGKDPIDVTVSDMRRHANIGEKQTRRFGPWPSFKRAHFAPGVEPDNKAVVEARSAASYVRKLEKIAGTADLLLEKFEARLAEVIAGAPRIPRVKYPKPAKRQRTREVFAVLSDLHFGYSVDPREVPGCRWDAQVAARRCARYALEVADYKPHHRKDQTLRVCLNGDIIQGLIHLDDRNIGALVDQVWEARWYLGQMIRIWCAAFQRVTVHCQTGNHDRVTYRGPGRATAQKWESHTMMLFLWLRDSLRDQPNVEVNIDRTPISRWETLGHVYAMAHGDTDLSIANPGNALNTSAITSQLNALALSPQFGGKLDCVILGHHHAPTFTTLPNGVDLVVNGNADGVSPYASSIGYRDNHPSQVIFEAVEGHPVGDFRSVRLWHADGDESLEEVIRPAPDWSQEA